MLESERTEYLARAMRLGAVTAAYQANEIDREEALELLSGSLSPGNTDVVDDREYLRKVEATTLEQAIEVMREEYKWDSGMH